MTQENYPLNATTNTEPAPESVPLRRPRWELFAQGVAAGLTYSHAYSEAGYSSHSVSAIAKSATGLLRNPPVASRVRYLLSLAAERAMVTAEDVTRVAWEIANTSKVDVARVSALTLLAKRHPEFSDKVDSRILHGHVTIERATPELEAPLDTKLLS